MKTKIKDMNLELRPRERLKKYGAKSLNSDELLAILLHTGTKEENVKELASRVISSFESINDLENASLDELKKIKGIKDSKATTILASIEFGKRVLTKSDNKIKINNNLIVYDLFKYDLVNSKQEHFIVLYLDTKKNLIKYETLYIGTISYASVHPREIFSLAYKYNASYIIIVHNHPTGDSTPSIADKKLTDKLIDIGTLMSIPLLDHIIIGNNNYYSFYDQKKVLVHE